MENVKGTMAEGIAAILPSLKSAIETGATYTGDLFVRFVKFCMVEQLVWLLLSFAAFATCIFALKYSKRCWKWAMKKTGYDKEAAIALAIVSFILPIMFAGTFASITIEHTIRVAKLIFIPEIYMIEYVQTNYLK